MTDFRNNISDILDAWGNYANVDPPGGPAFNSGHVQIKCFINSTCPFYKTPYKEDSIIFNNETYEEFKDYMPDRITKTLMTTPGLEGLYFEPRKVYRHNYMNKEDPDVDHVDYLPNASAQYKHDNFVVYYKNVSANNGFVVPGADKTRYRADHDWYIARSVFDDVVCSGGTVGECDAKAQWSYYNQPIPGNRVEEPDIAYDYPASYVQEYLNSIVIDPVTKKITPKAGVDPKISKFEIQMPVQTNTHDANAHGIHWKVSKRTPIFKGADFFVRFYKTANAPVKYIYGGSGYQSVPFNDDKYAPLDHTSSEVIQVDVIDDFKKYINEAVRSPKNATSSESNLYDFYTQAYYIIEMTGITSNTSGGERYFIIIPDRGNPLFVHFFKGENADKAYAKRLGRPFRGVSGSALINAGYFEMTVRNHLGRLVIQFEGQGLADIPPWIVERRDWVPKKLSQAAVADGETSYMAQEVRDLVVPKGIIHLWGGNIRCGFIFGILQYEEGHVSFIYPPRNIDDGLDAGETNDKAFEDFPVEEVTFTADYFKSDPIWLPMNRTADESKDYPGASNSAHELSFVANSGPQMEQGSVGDSIPEFNDQPLFTQDAQYYKNYMDAQDTQWEKGYFYYNRPIREFSPDIDPSNRPKTSNIIIKKYKYLNYDRTRHQGFNTFIGMMCGDHYFNGSSNINTLEGMGAVSKSLTPIDATVIPDNNWYVPNCKTPILTNLRLMADNSNDPRWSDGTSISSGVKFSPESGAVNEDIFLDASDHVMNFSHSWTSSGLTSLEHSGTIQFYLNHNMIAENLNIPGIINNVTDSLLLLQDKTFYIEIWAGYKSCNYTRIPGFYKMFTGMCTGGSISYEYNKIIMTCKMSDYSVVLKNMLFFNSPWFDAMKDATAIREILRMAGFRDEGAYDPARLINDIADDSTEASEQAFYPDRSGRVFKYVNFGLPSGYNRLDQPSLKFNDGDPFIDAINKISSYSAKIFYFDEFGMAHYEDFQDVIEENFQGQVSLTPLYAFTTNPEISAGQLVFNKTERAFDVDSVVSHLKTLTNTPDMHMLIRDRIKWESIENPTAAGFLGYQKTFFQAESMFGSKEAQISAMNKYAVMFKPIVSVKFETYGVPLRATDIISIDGEVVRVIKVDHAFSAEKNQWWMNVDCQRFQVIEASDTQQGASGT